MPSQDISTIGYKYYRVVLDEKKQCFSKIKWPYIQANLSNIDCHNTDFWVFCSDFLVHFQLHSMLKSLFILDYVIQNLCIPSSNHGTFFIIQGLIPLHNWDELGKPGHMV